jgi:hypothetical protein
MLFLHLTGSRAEVPRGEIWESEQAQGIQSRISGADGEPRPPQNHPVMTVTATRNCTFTEILEGETWKSEQRQDIQGGISGEDDERTSTSQEPTK